jgi:hypothetical protein
MYGELKALMVPPISVITTCFKQKISITFQKLQASMILTQGVAVRLATFQLPPLIESLPIITLNILFIVGN